MIDEGKWLSQRLTDARLTSDVWVQLFEAIEELWDEMAFPAVGRIKDARKTFTQDREALARLMDELGDVFEVPTATESYEQHLGILRRRWEVHRKRVQPMLQSLLERNFPGLGAVWQALYCPKDQDYGNADLFTLEQLDTDAKTALNDHFLTSRGNISIFLPAFRWLMSQRGQVDRDILESVYRQARRILPEHIVLDFLSLRDHADKQLTVVRKLHNPVSPAVIVNQHHISELAGMASGKTLLISDLKRPVVMTTIVGSHVSELAGAALAKPLMTGGLKKPAAVLAASSPPHVSEFAAASSHHLRTATGLFKPVAVVVATSEYSASQTSQRTGSELKQLSALTKPIGTAIVTNR